ncbi:unnamed protein product, partial [Coregonus sp. 'balchen']
VCFSECHCCDEERAQRLLIRISSSWGQTTCLRLALEADDKSFVAHSGVQALLTQIWCGELAVDNPLWRVLLCMLFFPLIYTGFLGFRRDESIHRETERSAELLTMEIPLGLKPLTVSTRLVSLFTSPQVKFYWNILSYFSFLLLFSVVLMIDFQATPSWREGLLYVWFISLVCEEVRQVRHLALLTTRLFYAGKVILCIDFIIFCLRLMAIFIISKTLGPKIIIVRRMKTPSSNDSVQKTPSSNDSVHKTPSSNDSVQKTPSSNDSVQKTPSSNDSVQKTPSSNDAVQETPSSNDSVQKTPSSNDSVQKTPSSNGLRTEDAFKTPSSNDSVQKTPSSNDSVQKTPSSNDSVQKTPSSNDSVQKTPSSNDSVQKTPSSNDSVQKTPSSNDSVQKTPSSNDSVQKTPSSNDSVQKTPSSNDSVQKTPSSNDSVQKTPSSNDS